MNASSFPRARGWPCAALALLWALPAAAQDTTVVVRRMPPLRTFLADDGWALVVIVVCGMLGAFVADVVTDGGRVERTQRDDTGWTLGFLGKLIVGAVAALVTLGLNPAEGWWQLIAAALAAGVGAEAIVLAILEGKNARDAENAREQTEKNARKFAHGVLRQLDGVDEGIDALEGGSALDDGRGLDTKSFDASGTKAAPTAPGIAALRARTSMLRAEVAAFTEGRSIHDVVRDCISRAMPGHDMSNPLNADAGVLAQIDECIRARFPNLRPKWVTGTTKKTDTLDSLARDLFGRGAS